MEMRDGLTGVRSVIGDDPIASIIEPVLAGDARRQRQRVRRDVPVIDADIAQGREVLSRHDEHVDRRLRVQVAKGDVMFALRDELRGKLTVRNAAEDAIGNGRIIHYFRHSARPDHRPVVRSEFLQS